MKRALSRFLRVVVVLALLLGVLFGALQTPPGKSFFASTLSRELSRSQNLDVRIGTIHGWIPGHVRVDRVEIGDADGIWLMGRDVHCRWVINELFAGRVRLRELGADTIEWRRFPKSGNPPAEKKKPKGLAPRIEIQLDGLKVDHLQLDKELAGTELEYSVLSGGISLERGQLSGGVAIKGDAEGWVDFNAELANPSANQLTLSAELKQMRKPTFGLDKLSGNGEAKIDSGGVSATIIAQMEEKGQTGRITTRLHYADRQLDLQQFQFKSARYAAEGNASLGFSKGLIDVALQTELFDAHANRYAMSASAAVATSNKTWTVDLKSLDIAGWSTLDFAVAGTVDPDHIALKGVLKTFDVDLFPLADLADFNGRAGGRFSIAGSLEHPKVDAAVDVLGFSSKKNALEELPKLDFHIAGSLAEGRLDVSTCLTNFQSGYLSADLAVPCAFSFTPFVFQLQPDQVQGQLDADLDVALFNGMSFLENQRVEGLVQARLTRDVQGMSGYVKIERGSYEQYDWGILFRDIGAELEAIPDGFAVKQGSATDGRGGKLSLSGGIHDGAMDLRLKMDKAKVIQRPDVTTSLSGSLALSGKLPRPAITGKLVIDRADILPDNMLIQKPKLLTNYDARSVAAQKTKERHQRHFPFGLDVKIDMPDQVFVNASLIDSIWGGSLQVNDTPAGVSVKGKIAPRRGFVEFVGKKFRFQQGEVLFDGVLPFSPVLNNLTAEYARNDFSARLILNGSVNDPQYRMESTPAMPSDEILSHVLFNRDTSTISPYQAFQLAAAAQQLSGGLSGPGFMYQFRQAVGIDTLEWREAEVEGGASSVAAGKYLTPDLYIEVDSTLGGEASTGMMAEYEINRHFSVETSAGPKMRPGIGFNWKNDY